MEKHSVPFLHANDVAFRQRLGASAWCAGAVMMAIGAKATAVVLGILAIVTPVAVSWDRERFNVFLHSLMRPARPVVVAMVFAFFCCLTALWAPDAKAALLSGLWLLGVIVSGEVLRSSLARITPNTAVLTAGWFVIGLVAGSFVLLEELFSGYAGFRWLLTHVFHEGVHTGSMVELHSGTWVVLTMSLANWSIAAINILMWPALLITCALLRGAVQKFAGAAVFILFAAITFVSDHQTSQLGFIVSVIVFAVALAFTEFARRAMLFGCLLAVLVIVPVSYAVDREWNLSSASWAQTTLKERFTIWGNVAARVPEAPILGIGASNTTNLDTYTHLPAGSPAAPHHPHDMLLQVWFELGAVGAGLLILFLLTLFQAIRALDREAQVFALAAIAVVFVESMATWSLWSLWFQAVVVVSAIVLWLGVRLRHDAAHGDTARFGDIWLPLTLRPDGLDKQGG